MTPALLTHLLAFVTGGITGVFCLIVWCMATQPPMQHPGMSVQPARRPVRGRSETGE